MKNSKSKLTAISSLNPKINQRIKQSKRLSYLLRHGAEKEGLKINKEGFVLIDDLTAKYPELSSEIIQEIVENCQKNRFYIKDGKIRANQGHSLDVEVEMELVKDHLQIPTVIHGTFKSNWESIKASGLKRMNRKHIHFAVGMLCHRNDGIHDNTHNNTVSGNNVVASNNTHDNALSDNNTYSNVDNLIVSSNNNVDNNLVINNTVTSGMRKSCDLFIYLNAKKCMEDGINFYRSANNVILSPGIGGVIDSKYFESVRDEQGSEYIQ